MSQILPSPEELAAHAAAEPEYARWLQGRGPLQHSVQTQAAVFRVAHQLVQSGLQPDLAAVYRLFGALDRLTCAGLWLVAHMTYAKRVRLDGTPLQAADFKALAAKGGGLHLYGKSEIRAGRKMGHVTYLTSLTK